MKTIYKIGILYINVIICFCFSSTAFSQEGILFPKGIKKDKISFQLVNNLVIIPVEVNGVPLSFLLDTGVDATILFGVTESDTLLIKKAKPIKIRGLGAGEGVQAFKSDGNTFKVGDAKDEDHPIFLIFDESLNFSTRMGVAIHGILGYEFFKNFIVKTDYVSQKVTFYNPEKYSKRKCGECEVLNLEFHNNKPYVEISMTNYKKVKEKITLLVDSGSSDALWLFEAPKAFSEEEGYYFNDYLGLGFSGNIFGKRSKLDEIWVGSHHLENVKVAFPDKQAIEGIQFYKNRDGSIGGDILKRFTVWVDYSAKTMTLRKNSKFNEPFYYNMAGLTVEHDGLDVITELTTRQNLTFSNSKSSGAITPKTVVTDASVYTQIILVPRYIIVEVREGSPADLLGLIEGDEIVQVNGLAAYKIKLYALNALFSSKVGKKIKLLIRRDGRLFKTKLTLEKVL